MPLAGYRDLATLKARLLPADMGDDTTWDADLAAIGEGVAAEFDLATGRTLRRTVGYTFEAAADCESYVMGCYPIEAVTAISLRSGGTEHDVLASLQAIQHYAGILEFGACLGSHLEVLTFTLTGGFWCDDGETAMPNAAKALPNDLLLAWYQQCRAVCEAENIIRTKGAGKSDGKAAAAPLRIDNLTLTPAVKRTLQLYTRMG